MASDPITSWQREGEKGEARTDFIFLGSKISVDGDRSQEIQSCLLLGRKSMTNLDNVLQSRDITMLTNIHIVKAMVFPVVMHGFKSWSIKKAECRRTDAFKLWCWRRLRVPWCWERLKAWGEEGKRGWDGWMVSSTQWTWTWANPGRSNRGQRSLVCCSPWGRKDLIGKVTPTSMVIGFPGGSDGKESACNVGESSSISGGGWYPGEENGYPLQYSC